MSKDNQMEPQNGYSGTLPFPTDFLFITFTRERDQSGSLKGYLRMECSQAPVAHACNSNYSGGRDQKAHSSKLGLAEWLNR
jgi:hypothetical protein